MTGERFETEFCELLKACGYWALKIPKNKSGAQPFDVVAVNKIAVLALDCKVCSTKYLALDRIEDNQWLAFEVVSKRTMANVGVVAYYKGNVYYIPYSVLLEKRESGKASVKVDDFTPVYGKEEIKEILGRYME